MSGYGVRWKALERNAQEREAAGSRAVNMKAIYSSSRMCSDVVKGRSIRFKGVGRSPSSLTGERRTHIGLSKVDGI